jgi:hypothetical protein
MKRDYEQCVKEKKILPIEKIEDRSLEIIALVKHKLEFWKKVKKIADDYPTILIESYYEIIKELFTVLINKEGFKLKLMIVYFIIWKKII